ncbi:hypothetical protein HMPREF1986_01159 [Oribacterium sp. oral taxon 078 str. F0263]|nr:hypothetical protein HMPREF1986_01159 [Oribacterium sp. oral taxon 078 str. F0263]
MILMFSCSTQHAVTPTALFCGGETRSVPDKICGQAELIEFVSLRGPYSMPQPAASFS